MARSLSHPSVFINCPFDPEFQPFLRAILKQVTPRRSRRKTCLIFVKDSRNLSFITDINGMDVQGHGDSPEKSIESIRNWLCNDAKIDGKPASVIGQLFKKFESEFPEIVKRIGYQPNEPQYGDVLKITRDWLKEVRFLVSAKSGASASVKVGLIDPDKSMWASFSNSTLLWSCRMGELLNPECRESCVPEVSNVLVTHTGIELTFRSSPIC